MENRQYQAAINLLYDNLSGLDWDGSGTNCNPALQQDANILQAINDLHAARLCLQGQDSQHFADCAILKIKVLGGDTRAEAAYRLKMEMSALIAEAELSANHDATLNEKGD